MARGDVEAVVGVLGGEVREVHLDGGRRIHHIIEGHVNTMIGHRIVLYYGHNMGTILSCLGHVNTMIGHIIVLYYGHNMGTILSC